MSFLQVVGSMCSASSTFQVGFEKAVALAVLFGIALTCAIRLLLTRRQRFIDLSDVPLHISRMYVYPIKSCRGVCVLSAKLTERGLENDRLYMVVDAEGRSVTMRNEPRLALVQPSFDESGALIIVAPGMSPLRHVKRMEGQKELVKHFGFKCEAIDQGDEVARFFSQFLRREDVRLMRMRDGFVRQLTSRHVEPGRYQASLADGWPYMLASETSLLDLSRKSPRSLDMRRFRPNFVVDDKDGLLAAWDEDTWKRVAIGDAGKFGIPKHCTRCKVTTVDPASGVVDEDNQPLETLKEHRSIGRTVVFGRYLVPECIGKRRNVVVVGDRVAILEKC